MKKTLMKFRRKPIFLITQNEGKETKNEATSLQNKCVQHPLWQALFSFNLASFSLFEYAHMPSLHNIYEPTKGKIIKNKNKNLINTLDLKKKMLLLLVEFMKLIYSFERLLKVLYVVVDEIESKITTLY